MNNHTRPTLIIGLGNPGSRYVNTYHNVGAKAVRALVTHSEDNTNTPHRLLLFTYWKRWEFTFVIPSVFMNDSGRAVRAACTHFRTKPKNLLVVHDDSDLPLGSFRMGFGRGSAGHHGVYSVIESLGTKNFWRFRIGIRKKEGKAERFVLKTMSRDDERNLYSAFEALRRKLTEKENP